MKLLNKQTLLYVVCAGLLTLLGSYSALAQNNSLIPPEPLDKAQPEPPAAQFGPSPEGWVEVRYSVLADGTTGNIETLDVMPPRFDTDSTIEGIEGWTFTPATSNGVAVDWHNNTQLISFDSEMILNEAGPMLSENYFKIEEYLEDEKFSRARTRSDKLFRESIFSLYDIGVANMQRATIEVKLEEYHAAYDAIRRATMPGVSQLDGDELLFALQYRFSIELALGRIEQALETYERHMEIQPPEEGHYMHSQAETIRSVLAGDRTIAIKGKIAAGSWRHQPGQRMFAIADVEGQLDSIEVFCNRRIISLEYQADVEWSLPAGWGECSLSVLGDNDSTFSFYEFK